MSSENRWMSPQPFDSDVPPAKAGAASLCSTAAITASARTTCQSFSTSPSSVARAPATCSTSRRSSTLKAHEYPVIADAAAHPLGDGDGPAGRYLGCLTSLIRLLQPCRRGRDAETVERFRREGTQPLHRGRRAIKGR